MYFVFSSGGEDRDTSRALEETKEYSEGSYTTHWGAPWGYICHTLQTRNL